MFGRGPTAIGRFDQALEAPQRIHQRTAVSFVEQKAHPKWSSDQAMSACEVRHCRLEVKWHGSRIILSKCIIAIVEMTL